VAGSITNLFFCVKIYPIILNMRGEHVMAMAVSAVETVTHVLLNQHQDNRSFEASVVNTDRPPERFSI
jgi:hypothetical protein